MADEVDANDRQLLEFLAARIKERLEMSTHEQWDVSFRVERWDFEFVAQCGDFTAKSESLDFVKIYQPLIINQSMMIIALFERNHHV